MYAVLWHPARPFILQRVLPIDQKEVQSVGCPTWEARAAECREAGDDTKTTSMYAFGLDAGPENVKFASRVRTALKDVKHVMFIVVFCLMHQAHLITKNVLKVPLGFYNTMQ